MDLSPELRKMVAKAARGYLAEMHGEYCQCADPDIEGRKASLCFRCGLVNQQRIKEIETAMLAPHPFEPYHLPLVSNVYCDFCTQRREDSRHAD